MKAKPNTSRKLLVSGFLLAALGTIAQAQNPAVALLTTEGTALEADVTSTIPVGLAIGVLIMGALLLWRTFRKFAR